MKSFRNIVMEDEIPEVAAVATDIPVTNPEDNNPATVNDTGLDDGDILNSVDGNGEPTVAAEEADGIENSAEQVAGDIVEGEGDDEDDATPVAAETPHEEPDGDEGPNPTAPSDNDGDEEVPAEDGASAEVPEEDKETPTVPETAGEEAQESLVIVQCGLIALESAMRLNDAVATEAFLGAKDTRAKKAVVESFTEKAKGVWAKLRAFLTKIKDAIVRFVQKIVLYVKKIAATVYAKLSKKLYSKKAGEAWSKAAGLAELKVPNGFASGLSKVDAAKDATAEDVTPKGSDAAKVDAETKDAQTKNAEEVKKLEEFLKGESKTVKVSVLFKSYKDAENIMLKDAADFIKVAEKNRTSVVKACDSVMAELKKEKDSPLLTAKVKYVNTKANCAMRICRLQTAIMIKEIQLSATAMKRVAKYKADKNSYINDDLMAFFSI